MLPLGALMVILHTAYIALYPLNPTVCKEGVEETKKEEEEAKAGGEVAGGRVTSCKTCNLFPSGHLPDD